MSKQYNIRWRKSDYAKLSHLVRKVNQKVFAIEVKRPELFEYQPSMLDYQEVKATIKTRRDFNNFMNKYKRYLKDGAEELQKSDRGAVATNWQVREFEISQFADNVRKRAELKNQETVTVQGKDTGYTPAEMGRVRVNELLPSNKKFKNMSKEEFEKAFRNFERKMSSTYNEEMKRQLLRNYVKGLIAEGYPQELIDLMKHITPDTFHRVFQRDDTAQIDFIYDPIDLQSKADTIIGLWSKYANNGFNNDFPIDEINEEIQNEYENGERIQGVGRVKRSRKRRKRR